MNGPIGRAVLRLSLSSMKLKSDDGPDNDSIDSSFHPQSTTSRRRSAPISLSRSDISSIQPGMQRRGSTSCVSRTSSASSTAGKLRPRRRSSIHSLDGDDSVKRSSSISSSTQQPKERRRRRRARKRNSALSSSSKTSDCGDSCEQESTWSSESNHSLDISAHSVDRYMRTTPFLEVHRDRMPGGRADMTKYTVRY